LCFMARAHMMPSVAPTAPKEWPVMDFVPETSACGMTLAMALVSGPSPVGVAVAWALTCPISSAARPESARAWRIARSTPRPSSSGAVTW
jgi:hypothetical protein